MDLSHSPDPALSLASRVARSASWLVPRRPERWTRETFRPATWPNSALAGFCLAISAIDIVTSRPTITLAGVLLELIALGPFVALVWRPRIAVPLLWLGMVCWLISSASHVSNAGDTCMLVAVYTIGTQMSWRRTAVAVVITALAAMPAAMLEPHPDFPLALALPLYLMFAAFYVVVGALFGAVGLYMGRRRAFVAGLVDRTRDLEREKDLLEAERDLMARQAVAVERARIARELHDVVAHHVSVMVIQAGAAEASLPADAAASAQAIAAVRETGREALAEMRRLLGLLRSDAGLDPATAAANGVWAAPDQGRESLQMAPQPGLADLAALVERTREAGVEVETEVEGQVRHLPPGVDLSVYRIVQEALTNTLRHAGPGAKASLHLTYGAASVTAEVRDDGAGRASGPVERRAAVGHGLLGMRERVMLFGGRLQAGPRPEGGFRIEATFPLDGATSDSAEVRR